MARALRDLGVDVIEAGFPIASPGDFEAVQAIAREIHGPIICGLARCNPADIDRAAEALKDAAEAAHPRLPGHQRHPPRVQAADDPGGDRPPGRRGRQARPRLLRGRRVLPRGRRPHRAGLPGRSRARRRSRPGRPRSTSPTRSATRCPSHYADDHPPPEEERPRHRQRASSASTATTTSAWPSPTAWPRCRKAPARSNAPSTASASGPATPPSKRSSWRCSTRQDFYGLSTGINTRLLYPTSRKLSRVTGMQVQRNKAIVGQNAFAHEAGIHQDGMLKDRSTYEIMKPEDVGIAAHGTGARQAPRPARAEAARSPTWATTSTTTQLQRHLRGVQGAGGPQEGDLRRRHRGPGREPAPQRADRGVDAGELQSARPASASRRRRR